MYIFIYIYISIYIIHTYVYIYTYVHVYSIRVRQGAEIFEECQVPFVKITLFFIALLSKEPCFIYRFGHMGPVCDLRETGS